MIINKIKNHLDLWLEKNNLNELKDKYIIEKSKNRDFGDISTNIALVISKQLKTNPLDLAQKIKHEIPNDIGYDISVTKPGFINLKISSQLATAMIKTVIDQASQYGRFEEKDKKISVEYVSANPTGLLHIGHARNAVLGNCIINVLEWYGYRTISEYVVNDAGNQMNNLATAILIRYKQLFNINVDLPEDSYHGEEIIEVAKKLKDKYGDQFVNLNIDSKNFWIEDISKRNLIRKFGRDTLLDIIKQDLKSLGVEIELYFSELTSHENKLVDKVIDDLLNKKVAYKKDGAIWLETTKFGDDKDRVLIKSDGVPTYFAPDIVYHNHKFTTNGTDVLVNIWGADHYSYISRMKIAMQCLGYDPNDLIVICMQMVKLTKNGQEFKMSKRTGQSLTLRDLVEALGKDVARWYLVSQSANNHIVIDVDEATKKSNSNPIFYVQYAHARANQLLNKHKLNQPVNFDHLNSDIEREIIVELDYFKHTIENCAKTYEPYKLTVYLNNLAKLFHSYYSNTRIYEETNKYKEEQYYLIKAIKQVIYNGLKILGIEPIEKM